MSSNEEWREIRLVYVFERQIAFCIPTSNRIVAMSYEGLHDIDLGPPVRVHTDKAHAEDYEIYDCKALTLDVAGAKYPALGLHDGCPFPATLDGLCLRVDHEASRVEVLTATGRVVLVNDRSRFRPGWLVASFSPDGRLFVVGTPDHLFCYRR